MTKKPKCKDYNLSSGQRKKVIESCNGKLEELPIRDMLSTGQRVGEFLHMRRSWIDKDFNHISIPKLQKCNKCYACRETEIWHKHKDRKTEEIKTSLYKPKGYWAVKTPSSARIIKIPDPLKPLLKAYFSKYDSIIQVYENRTKIWKIMQRVSERAKIKLFPHMLRSTFAEQLIEHEADAIELTHALGWSSYLTAQSYIKASEKTIDNLHNNKLKGVDFCG